ncbi:MAG: hypothetical protein HY664_02145 [Chloroflexi bacterium]|nr:hypothetical protein [Chloroflexota bacterium]
MECARHPGVETYLRCGKCGQPICLKCTIQTPVGARCPACARLQPLPTYQVSLLYYVRAAGAGIFMGVASGIFWGILSPALPIFYFNLLVALGLGYAVGEVISLSVNRKRGRGLQVIAGACMLISYVIGQGFISITVLDLLVLAVAIFMATERLH